MVTQEILDTFVFSTIGGEKFGVNDPITHDEIIGYYPTKEEAENACIDKMIEIVKNK